MNTIQKSPALQEGLETARAAVEQDIKFLLSKTGSQEDRLIDAMQYGCLNGGKRVRPFLVMATAALFNVSPSSAVRTAAATEMVHSYSLVHDDLPAMDDDDLRRGKPTCHVAFDEATAILAGDALLTQAFEILASEQVHADPAVRCSLITSLAQAVGRHGMVGGQMLDLMAEDVRLGMNEITRLQRMKTGCLISFSCEAGAILGKAPEPLQKALLAYAHDLGLAFQIADDLLDVEGEQAEVGKTLGKDVASGKETFVSLMGAERARAQANMLADQAARHLEIFDGKANVLKDLARYVVERRN